MSWTEFVKEFFCSFFCLLLKTFGTFWNILEKGGRIWIWIWNLNWIWIKFELHWKIFEIFLKNPDICPFLNVPNFKWLKWLCWKLQKNWWSPQELRSEIYFNLTWVLHLELKSWTYLSKCMAPLLRLITIYFTPVAIKYANNFLYTFVHIK